MRPEFYEHIYSEFSRESVSNLSVERLAIFINSKYQIPVNASIAVLNDNMKLYKLSLLNVYEDFMKFMYNSDHNVLTSLIEAFKNCDVNDDGYIDSVDKDIINSPESNESESYHHSYSQNSIFDYIYRFDTNSDCKLNFLDFNDYMTELRKSIF